MEKMIYPVWKRESQSSADFRQQLLGPVSEGLIASGVRSLRISVVDDDVAPAAGLRQENSKPLMDGMISMWVDSAIYRQAQETIIAEAAARFHGYLVTESEPVVNTLHPPEQGQRTYGMCEVVFLQRPPRVAHEEWLNIWHQSHTQIAIDTQSTFGYRQNVVVRALTYAAPVYDAIIEENFPPEAMTSPNAFYDAVGDDEKCQANLKTMVDSVMRFIDFDKIDVLPTSEYTMLS